MKVGGCLLFGVWLTLALLTGDFYQILGVGREATNPEIKKGFRKLALKYHPDKNPSDDAQADFITILTAYEVLVDPTKRAAYDAGNGNGNGNGNANGNANGNGNGNDNAQQGASYNYEEFYKHFEESLKYHYQAHAAAVEGLDPVAAKAMRDHLKNHYGNHHKQHSGGADADAGRIDFDTLWEDMSEDENQHFEKMRANAVATPTPGQDCKTITKTVGGSVTTETVCTQSTEKKKKKKKKKKRLSSAGKKKEL